jgi:N-acetylglucosaminyldiphosphoundecaprenol N-acetyl-beta-D-mannosaminyltransferase
MGHLSPNPAGKRPSLMVLGVRIDNVTIEDAIDWATWALGQTGPGLQIATVNVEFLVAAQRDHSFLSALNGCALTVPDSIGVNIGARLLGRQLAGRVAGIDLMVELCGLAASSGARPYLLGAEDEVADVAAAQLVARFPEISIAGTYSGSPAPEEEHEIVARIRSSRADLLFVAYGAPAQDLWLSRNLTQTGARIGMGVGGSFDYIAGIVPRAPAALRRLGLEWAFRLASQPSRWRRMLALPKGMVLAVQQRLTQGRAPQVAAHKPTLDPSASPSQEDEQ